MKPATTLYLYVWRSGRVEHGTELPEGSVLLAKGRCPADFERITGACRQTHNGWHVVGSVHDAWRAEQREQAEQIGPCGDETPEKALDRWLCWCGLGKYAQEVSA